MDVVEHVLQMRTGYVLDFSNRTFDDFIAHEIGVDATAPRFSENGESKANRLRSILRSLPADRQAKLLSALLKYRDSPVRAESIGLLDDEWREGYGNIIRDLKELSKKSQKSYASSSWTGRRSVGEQVAVIRGLAPLAIGELDALASIVESKRFNDPITADAVECLRELHMQIGELLSAIDRGAMTRSAVEAIEKNRERLLTLLQEGAKLSVVAPTMTFGVMHILSWLTGVPIDSTLVSTVFGTIVGADVVKSFGKQSSVAQTK
jgi:hypothetical protein